MEFGEEWHIVKNTRVRNTMLKCCDARLKKNDIEEWAVCVKAQTLNCPDFVQSEARYHQHCKIQFLKMKNLVGAKAKRY